MAEDASAHPDLSLDARTERALAALLAVSGPEAAAVRDRSPARRRPSGRHGPVLDLGGPDDAGRDDAAGPDDRADGHDRADGLDPDRPDAAGH